MPPFPAWTATDLLWQLGGEVHHQWAWVVEHRPRDPDDGYALPPRPDSVGGCSRCFDASARLVPGLGFIARRQALEVQVHRVDAEQVVGDVRPLDPALSADGVEEVLAVMYGGCPPVGGGASPVRPGSAGT